MSRPTPGSWHAELAEAHAAINELSALVATQDATLRMALEVLNRHWFTVSDGEDFNNDDVIAAIEAQLRPPLMVGIWPSKAGEGTHDVAATALTRAVRSGKLEAETTDPYTFTTEALERYIDGVAL